MIEIIMESLSANEAKTHFGDLLLKVQREPVQINRNGKAVAVVLSVEDYLNLESLKMQYLKTRVEQAREEMAMGRTIDGNAFFDELLNGTFD
ncbi:type II toxin-antitoxin system Phd/YefM family antitoxin [Legionella shakespearei]|nr:type II toxin-antitoxin system Phd/YefM family antitoxin [Legionella shakespearei]